MNSLQTIHTQTNTTQTQSSSALDLTTTVLATLTSPLTRRAYKSRIDKFLAYVKGKGVGLDWMTVEGYIAYVRDEQKLSISSRNQSLAAIKKLAQVSAKAGVLSWDEYIRIAGIKGGAVRGRRTGNWLGEEVAVRLLAVGGSDAKSCRDRLILALMIGGGLRRSEVVGVRWGQVQERDGRLVLVDVMGKGERMRSVPLPEWVRGLLRDWQGASGMPGVDELLIRSMDGTSLSVNGVWDVVKVRAKEAGIAQLAPHDLRRTFAKLARTGGASIESVQTALGHSSVSTTERYLGTAMEMELGKAACDRVLAKKEVA